MSDNEETTQVEPPEPDELLDGDPVGGDEELPGSESESQSFADRLSDAFLSTEPVQDPAQIEEQFGVPGHVAQAIVGTKKWINGFIGAGVSAGVTATEHFIAAGIELMFSTEPDEAPAQGGDEPTDENGEVVTDIAELEQQDAMGERDNAGN